MLAVLIVIILNYQGQNYPKRLTRWLPGNIKRPQELSHILFSDLGSALMLVNEDLAAALPSWISFLPPNPQQEVGQRGVQKF